MSIVPAGIEMRRNAMYNLTDVSTPGDDVYVPQQTKCTWEVAFRYISRMYRPLAMTWVAQRQTTEEEDLVYCLLGLCEVSMPPIYGEGKEVALKRLEMTVKGFSTNESEPKDLKDNTASFIVPFGRNLNFIGRGTQLTEVEAKLFTGGRMTKVAITGLGGIGKTQLLLELVYRIRDRYKDCLVIWIPATNTESLHQAYREVARQLKIPGSDEDKADGKETWCKII
ncbi:hypothetical protein SS1G_14522 [Sclerotinia sclerotiorum 1980 UF-70]|uniref:NB-ARC domain-containing protein n=1 Tax=Sclerotinia sclerotiorum (strain ATCC 18683 / 1980 / Ss-1) TaxID=665079 RepID=A7K6N5_SCLS1|nr:hypothetical protein SS1G_14522 [Sclerotinia sclerotiorum 1980 UF-70]EDO00635.1 hypothetical protein SS1G_14522 [Sclerotinia sclerotiorum 1980 UF-70]